MENSYGTVRVTNIRTAAGMLKTIVELDNVELNGNVELEIRERLETEKDIDDVESFDWEPVVEGAEELTMINKIKGVLRRYFECNDNGDLNPEFDEYLTPTDAIDEIHRIVGNI